MITSITNFNVNDYNFKVKLTKFKSSDMIHVTSHKTNDSFNIVLGNDWVTATPPTNNNSIPSVSTTLLKSNQNSLDELSLSLSRKLCKYTLQIHVNIFI